VEFFRAIARSGARALLIGRRALIALGIPVLTADDDFWVNLDDVIMFNTAVAHLGLVPNRRPEDVGNFGHYSTRPRDRDAIRLLEALQLREQKGT
jgi:hypothetical protein